jgi:hypothetical protein
MQTIFFCIGTGWNLKNSTAESSAHTPLPHSKVYTICTYVHMYTGNTVHFIHVYFYNLNSYFCFCFVYEVHIRWYVWAVYFFVFRKICLK